MIDKNFLVWKVLCNEDYVRVGSQSKQDLTKISQDLSKVIMVDCNPNRTIQVQNLINIKKFSGKAMNTNDHSLRHLTDFFQNTLREKRSGIDLRDLARAYDYEHSELAGLV